MSEAAINISFSNRVSSSSDCLTLEQEPWAKDIGETSNMQGLLGIAAAINGGHWPEVRCGGLNGIFTATVYAYPCRSDLVWAFKVSHGTTTSGMRETAYREEVIQCSMRLVVKPDYPVLSVGHVAWIGSCYDNKGNITSRPTVSIIDNEVHFSKAVYGSLRFRYTVSRHVYKVEVSKRLQALENKYEAVAYAVWDYGVTWIDIEAPNNFDAFDGDCGNGAFYDDNLQDGYLDGQLSQTDICKPEYVNLPVAVTADRSIKVDYCSQEVVSDTVNETTDYEAEKSGCDE